MDAGTDEKVTCPITPFPPIAVELVRGIVEIAALADNQTACSLARLSKAVNKWVIPIIYHTVVLQHQSVKDAFGLALRGPSRVAASVRHLILLDVIWEEPITVAILLACINLETLMTDVNYLGSIADTAETALPTPSHVMLIARMHHQITREGHAILRNVKYLYVDYTNSEIFDAIILLPHLTHVGFGSWGDLDEGRHEWLSFVTGMLSRESLQMLLVYAFREGDGGDVEAMDGDIWIELASIRDERLIAGPGLSRRRQVALVKAGNTIWSDAAWRYKDWRQLVKGYGN